MSIWPANAATKRSSPLLAGALVAAFGAVAAFASVRFSGTKTGLVLALGGVFGPIAAYYALTAPLIFPFDFYVLAVPFDYAMNLTAFGTITKILGLAAGLALLIYLARAGRIVRPPPVLIIWGALVAWAAMTAMWAIDVPTVFSMLPTLVQLLVLFAVISLYPSDRRDVTFVLGASLVGGLIAAAWGVYLFHSGQDVIQNRLYIGRQAGAYSSSSLDPNHFAAGLLLPAALALVGTLHSRRMLHKIAFGGGFLLVLAGMMVAASRGAAVALAIMVVFLFFRGPWKLQLASFISLAGIVSLFFQGQLWARFSSTSIDTGSGRLDVWRVGLLALKSHWLLGAGYYNFPYAYSQSYLQAHTDFAKWFMAPHDLLIGTSVELGVIGLVLTLAGWYGQFHMLRIIPRESPDYPARLAIEAATVGLFVASLFLDLLATKYCWLTFIAGVLLYNSHRRSVTCAQDSSHTPAPTFRILKSEASSSP